MQKSRNKLSVLVLRISLSTLLVGGMFASVFSFPGELLAEKALNTEIHESYPPLAGGKVTIKSSGSGDVRWILPGLRALDPKIFGTPDAPLGFEPDVGVPIGMRLTNGAGTEFTTTMNPTSFSNKFLEISGEYKLKAVDVTAFDDPHSKDTVDFKVEFTSPDGVNEYKITVKKSLPVGPDHPFMGGVGTNFIHHG